MTIAELHNCKNKKGFIEGTPFGTCPEITGEVTCHGYTDYNDINVITGDVTRVTQVYIYYKCPGDLFGRTALIDRKFVELVND